MTRVWPAPLAALLLTLGLAAFFFGARPLDVLTGHVPPVEELVVEATRLWPGGIELRVRADGSQPVRIAQVQVDGAWWRFEQDPPGPVPRLGTARLVIPYPWVEGAAHHIVLVTSTGATFDHTVEVAVGTPAVSLASFAVLGLVGLFVGVVPVAIGMLAWPALGRLGPGGIGFLLSVTLGLLVFLLLDTLAEARDLAAELPGAFRGEALVWLVTALTALLLLLFGRRGGRVPEGASLAFFVALGIGLHNLGEGLAIGAALTTGEVALASFLVAGFTLHNVSEGVGIAAPLVRMRPPLRLFAGLVLLAGLPAVAGTWGGAFAFTPLRASLCFAVAAGAILQVIVEIGAWLARSLRAVGDPAASWRNLAGFALGVGVMYATALFVTV